MNVLSAVIMGFIIGYVEVRICISVYCQIFEMPLDYPVDWFLLFGVTLLGGGLTYLGT